MLPFLPQSRHTGRTVLLRLAGAGLLAVGLAGCVAPGPETTGSIGGAGAVSDAALLGQADALGRRFEANPNDPATALAYARVLRARGQNAQAVAVLQQAAIRNPRDEAVLGGYGKALADAGHFREAADVLARAHSPERPDWRILSVQGAVADQLGDFESAQRFYATALKIVPGEPSVLSNQGLSLALSRRLGEAEAVLRAAAADPRADGRVRQNLALVLGLQGKFAEAQGVLERDMPPAEAARALAGIRSMIAGSNSWKAIRQTAGERRPMQGG